MSLESDIENGIHPKVVENAFTKARAAGLMPGDADYPAGAGPTGQQAFDVRSRIDVGKIVARLERLMNESTQESSVVTAAKILLDKSLPTLNSVEQTTAEIQESPEQLEAKLRMLIDKIDPQTLSRILGQRARELNPALSEDQSKVA